MISHGNAGGSDRDVIFTLRVRPDERAASTVRDWGKSLADGERGIQDAVRKERRATSRETERLVKDEERLMRQSGESLTRETMRFGEAKRKQYQSIAAQARATSLTEIREARVSTDARIAEEERVARAVRKSQGERLLAEKRAGRADRAALESSFYRASYGASQLVRGASYLGLDETNAQSALGTIATAEGAASTLGGIVELGAAARTAGGALRGLASVGRAGPLGLIVGLLAATGKVGHELYSGNHGAGTLSSWAGSTIESADRLFAPKGGQVVTWRDFGNMRAAEARTSQAMQERLWQRAESERLAGLDQMIRSRRWSRYEDERAGISQSILAGNATEWQASTAGFIAAAGLRNDARRGRMSLGSIRDDRWVGAASEEVAAQKELLAARREMHRLGLAERDTRITAANEAIAKARDELQIHERITDTIRGRLTSAAERFGNLSPEEKLRTIQATQRLQAGDLSVSHEDRALVKSVGLANTDALAVQASLAEAERAGFYKVFGHEERTQLAQSETLRQQIEERIKMQQDVKVNLEFDKEAFGRMFSEQYAANLADMQELAREIAQQENEKLLATLRASQPVQTPPTVLQTNPKIQEAARMRS